MALKSIAIDDSACETRSTVAVTAGHLCAIPLANRPQRKLYRYSLSLSHYQDVFSCRGFLLSRRALKRTSQHEPTKRKSVGATRAHSIHTTDCALLPLACACVGVFHHFSLQTFQNCALGGEAESSVNFEREFFENDARTRPAPLSALGPHHPPPVRTSPLALRRLGTCFFGDGGLSSTINVSVCLWCTNAPI